MLHVLQGFTVSEASGILVSDPLDAGRHLVLASNGYSPAILDHAATGFVTDNPAYGLTLDVPHALRWRDFRRDWHLDFAATNTGRLMIPAGFHEGASACLRLPGGRYVGSVHVSWTKAHAATDDRREAVDRLRPVLADMCDLLREPNQLARRLHPETSARVLSRTGTTAELDDRQPGPHLHDAAPLWQLLTRRPVSAMTGRLLWLDTQRRCHRIEFIPCSRGAVLITEQPTARPHQLTVRELHTLHLVALGASNAAIAARLVISSRTVATHIEHLLAKLHCGTRAELAAVAVGEGLLLAAPPGTDQ
ncbi:response regulator transcription factor [Nocardia tengchongensis]|uniref:helix-turn-helix transcriptional regulator n=1 Tax=Nocardia tengchongensis TaxID=2055889 RepID=UPI00367B3261